MSDYVYIAAKCSEEVFSKASGLLPGYMVTVQTKYAAVQIVEGLHRVGVHDHFRIDANNTRDGRKIVLEILEKYGKGQI